MTMSEDSKVLHVFGGKEPEFAFKKDIELFLKYEEKKAKQIIKNVFLWKLSTEGEELFKQHIKEMPKKEKDDYERSVRVIAFIINQKIKLKLTDNDLRKDLTKMKIKQNLQKMLIKLINDYSEELEKLRYYEGTLFTNALSSVLWEFIPGYVNEEGFQHEYKVFLKIEYSDLENKTKRISFQLDKQTYENLNLAIQKINREIIDCKKKKGDNHN